MAYKSVNKQNLSIPRVKYQSVLYREKEKEEEERRKGEREGWREEGRKEGRKEGWEGGKTKGR